MPAPYRRILVALDGSKESDTALTIGIETAQKHGSTLALCHIVDDHTLKELRKQNPDLMLHALLQKGMDIIAHGREQAEDAGLHDVRVFIQEGSPKEIITETIADTFVTDLLIAGASGMGHDQSFILGSVSELVSRKASCDVLLVRNHSPYQ
ncbi:universal stress protein [Marinococcus luteus]|uniref:universal stress protein n=1 Tax=Marinococcus luteus TaxID=1122204 RepID=UPI002ACC54A3|nr:universal stress protein [Marinococcus luteus]MDZ5781932.1 universal stress protein [Marinococcus luteus]